MITAIFTAIVGLAVHQFTRRWDIKPFNCGLCMVFWTSIAVFSTGHFIPIVNEAVIFIGIAVFTRQILFSTWQTMF